MKANLKGLQGIKGLLLKHCEKLGMAVVGICVLMFVYASLEQEHLPPDKQSDKLEDLIRRARTRVEESRWEDAPEEDRTPPVQFVEERSVSPQEYSALRRGLNPAVVPPTVLRTDPELLAAQDVEVHGGAGLMAYIDEEIQRRRLLEEQKQAEARQREIDKDRKEQQRLEAQSFGGRGNRRRNRRDNERDNYMVDPDHPNRRRVVARVQPAGIPLRGDERVEIKYWATVVAKVPIQDQLNRYLDAFENAKYHDPRNDFPQYIGYYVERAEVKRGQKLQWQRVFVGTQTNIADVQKDWAQTGQEVIDGRAWDPTLTFPLPPLVGRNWAANATHPDIPLAVNVVPEDEELQPEEQEATEEEKNNFFAGQDGQWQRGPGNRGYSGRMGSEMGGFGGEFGGRGMGGYGGRGMGMSGGMGGMGGMGEGAMYGSEMGGYGGEFGGGAMSSSYGRREPGTIDVPHILMRYFDFRVQPGKRYKYRVKLAIIDPNRSVPKSALDGEVVARLRKEDKAADGKAQPLRWTDWSEPSSTVSIPRAGSVRVAEAKAPSSRSVNGEPSVTLLVQSFDVDELGKAIQAAKEEEFRRGHVANIEEDETEVLVEQNTMIDKIEFEFRTDITVLDIEGGDRLTSDLTSPARVLLMDPTGRLYIGKELDDIAEVELHRAVFADDESQRGRGSEYGRYPGFGGEMGGFNEF